jgi:hypothetical protein
MSMLNFQTMSRKELHNYVLAHREDQDAFYAYVDKLHNEGNWVEMPARFGRGIRTISWVCGKISEKF